jgi:hypothetical protein
MCKGFWAPTLKKMEGAIVFLWPEQRMCVSGVLFDCPISMCESLPCLLFFLETCLQLPTSQQETYIHLVLIFYEQMKKMREKIKRGE